MEVPVQHGRRWAAGRRSVLSSVLALLVLVPVVALFAGYRGDLATRADAANHERHGIEYLTALSRLTAALVDAGSAAVNGQPAGSDTLAEAVAGVDRADDRLGGMHRLTQRWSQLHQRIEQLTSTEFDDPDEAYSAYGEATDLLLDLHSKLQETSGLIRDPDADTYYLQDAAAEELPETMVAAGRLVDLVTLVSAGNPEEQAASAAEVSVARVAVASPAEDLGIDLQAALESTESRTLSSNVLRTLDRFLLAEDDLLARVPADGSVGSVDTGELAAARAELQTAGSELHTTLLQEMDALVEARIDDLQASQWWAAGVAAAAMLLVLGVAWLSLSVARRPDRRTGDGPAAAPAAPEPAAVQPELVGAERPDAR